MSVHYKNRVDIWNCDIRLGYNDLEGSRLVRREGDFVVK